MNIVVVTEHFAFGGLETQLLGFARQLRHRGHRVSFAVSEGGESRELHDLAGGRVLKLLFPPAMTGADALSAANAIAGLCRRERCDLLHLHPFRTLAVGALAAALAELPFVITLHGPASLALTAGKESRVWLAAAILPGAARVICVCPEVARMVAAVSPGARTLVLLNGVDVFRFRPARRDPEGPWAVISRLDPEKLPSVQFALEALLLTGAGTRRRARVFGDGRSRRKLEAWLARRPFGSRVTLEGRTSAPERELSAGFAGVAGMTRVVLEAGAMRLPVLLAGYDGVRGLVRRRDMDALADTNFSGRGRPVVASEDLGLQMKELSGRAGAFDVRPWVERNGNESSLWKRYLAEVRGLEAPDPACAAALLAAVERHRESPLFSKKIARALAEGFEGIVVPGN